MKNADYDVKEKSEIEIPASFEGSGVADDESDESAGLPVVDENYDPSEGSAEFWTGIPGTGGRLKIIIRPDNQVQNSSN